MQRHMKTIAPVIRDTPPKLVEGRRIHCGDAYAFYQNSVPCPDTESWGAEFRDRRGCPDTEPWGQFRTYGEECTDVPTGCMSHPEFFLSIPASVVFSLYSHGNL